MLCYQLNWHSCSNTYNAEREVRQRPAVMVEVRTQPARSSTRYYCEFEGCRDPTTGKRRSLSRRADLRRHVLSMHGGPTIDCEYKKCIRKGDDGFCREDHYREHLRGYHCQELPPRKTTRRNSWRSAKTVYHKTMKFMQKEPSHYCYASSKWAMVQLIHVW